MAEKEKVRYECKPTIYPKNAADAVYGLGFVGAAVYYIQNADTFWMGVYGILKAMVWPAILIYRALESLKIS